MFALLSATVRLHILWLLASGDRDVGTLADETSQSVATVSHHLGKLKLAGLVRARRVGKRQVYVVADAHVVDIVRLAIGQRLDQPQSGGLARHA
jgi:DNA-binding transcriptional ArsR family regulator